MRPPIKPSEITTSFESEVEASVREEPFEAVGEGEGEVEDPGRNRGV